LTCGFVPSVTCVTAVHICHSSSQACYQHIHALTCGNAELTPSAYRPYSSLAPSSRSIDARRPDEAPESPRGGEGAGEPTKAERPDAEPRGAEGRPQGRNPGPSGPGDRRKANVGSGPRWHIFGWAAGEARHSGPAARRVSGWQGDRSALGRAEPAGRDRAADATGRRLLGAPEPERLQGGWELRFPASRRSLGLFLCSRPRGSASATVLA
jgi:hypothetical protein